jgi:hypothetical protein
VVPVTSAVSVLVIDCTTIGAAADAHRAHLTATPAALLHRHEGDCSMRHLPSLWQRTREGCYHRPPGNSLFGESPALNGGRRRRNSRPETLRPMNGRRR